jgi:hypothetical protein
VRLRIVIHDGMRWPRVAAWDLREFGAMAWDASVRGIRAAWRFLRQAIRMVRQSLCAVRGHDDMLHLERMKMSLYCARCGRMTPGWTLDDPTPNLSPERTRYLELVRRRT